MVLVAREPELAAISRVLDRGGPAVRALVLQGAPGVGKTSLWEQGLVAGAELGMRVLLARAASCSPPTTTRPPPGAQPATRWGTEEVVVGLLGEGVTDVRSRTATVRQRFVDSAAFADLFLTYYGPTFAAAGRLDDDGRAALRADLMALAESYDRGDEDGLVCDWEYRIVTATRR